MSKTTPATLALTKAGVAFTLHTYEYDPDAERVGLHAAESLGVAPERVLKTLMAKVDGRPVCAVIPSNRELNLKRLAQAFGGKSAEMLKPADAERLTGYRVGGISPFGQKRAVPTAFEQAAFEHPRVILNGGQRGLQVELAPEEARRAAAAVTTAIVAALVA